MSAILSRRSVLQTGALVAAGALLPAARAAAEAPTLKAAGLGPFLAVYRREVEALAEKLRPRFEAGELHAYNDADGEAEERLGLMGYDPPMFVSLRLCESEVRGG